MSGRVKIKKIKAKQSQAKESLASVMAQLTGEENADPAILTTKILEIKQHLVSYHVILNTIYAKLHPLFAMYTQELADIAAFSRSILEEFGLEVGKKYSEYDAQAVNALLDLGEDEVNRIYRTYRRSDVIRNIINTGSLLKVHRVSIEEKDHSFIATEVFMVPFTYSKLDLKLLWFSTDDAKVHDFIMSALKRLLSMSKDIREVVLRPDVNVALFSELFIQCIVECKREVRGCDNAFRVIERSMGMLETNFPRYYRESIKKNNSAIITDLFFSDIARECMDSNRKIQTELSRIAKHFMKKANQIQDPKAREMLNKLSSVYQSCEDLSSIV
jgi:hypothetical protein